MIENGKTATPPRNRKDELIGDLRYTEIDCFLDTPNVLVPDPGAVRDVGVRAIAHDKPEGSNVFIQVTGYSPSLVQKPSS